MPKFKIEKADLIKLYIHENMRRRDIANNVYGCSDVLIKKKLKEYGIKKPKNLENANKERKCTLICLECGCKFDVVRFRVENEKWKLKFCSHKCSSDNRDLGEDHRRAKRNEIAARRRARMKDQTPELTDTEKCRMIDIYLNCPDGYEVDHKIPISKGGLHHPDNLQYLTISENRRKCDSIN